MKSIISLALAGILASSLVCAENLTQNNVAKARDIIAKAVDAQQLHHEAKLITGYVTVCSFA